MYKHSCPFCNHTWIGKKAVVVSCVRCKRRLDYEQKTAPNKSAAIQFIETNLVSAGMPPAMARNEAKRRLNSIIGFGGKY